MFIKYNVGSLWHRRAATLLTVVSIGATVSVFAGVLCLQRGFTGLFEQGGRGEIAIFLRTDANNESESLIPRERADTMMKEIPHIEKERAADGSEGRILASAETYLAVRLGKRSGGGETNVPIRGVQPMSIELLESMRIVEGAQFEPGTNQLVVGAPLVERIEGCEVGGIIDFNGVPFTVVGVFECEGPSRSEIWGDLDRLLDALERQGCTRIVARVKPGTDYEELQEYVDGRPTTQSKVVNEKSYLAGQTRQLSGLFAFMSTFLVVVMGAAAVFTGVNTMLSAVSARTREIGILLSLGFRPPRIFVSFLTESVVLGLVGGLVGCLLVLPLNGVQTGTTNWETFTEVAFAFQVTPDILLQAIVVSVVLGAAAGAFPALRAARMGVTEAMRR